MIKRTKKKANDKAKYEVTDMSDIKKQTTRTEYLSALLDDEAGVFEKRRLLDDVQKDERLQQKVANYSLIGEAMRNAHAEVTVRSGFLAGIHRQLEEEPTYNKVQVMPVNGKPAWLKPVTGVALAASLAAIVVVSLGLNNSLNIQPAGTQGATLNLAQQEVGNTGQILQSHQPAVVYNIPDAAWRKRLRAYVNSHAKYAATSAIMPSVRAVSYASNY